MQYTCDYKEIKEDILKRQSKTVSKNPLRNEDIHYIYNLYKQQQENILVNCNDNDLRTRELTNLLSNKIKFAQELTSWSDIKQNDGDGIIDGGEKEGFGVYQLKGSIQSRPTINYSDISELVILPGRIYDGPIYFRETKIPTSFVRIASSNNQFNDVVELSSRFEKNWLLDDDEETTEHIDVTPTIRKIIIYDGITQIGDRAFNNISSITSVIIPDSVISIGKYAFSNTKISSIYIPPHVTYLEEGCFENCKLLTQVIGMEGVKQFGANCFSNCPLLIRVDIFIPYEKAEIIPDDSYEQVHTLFTNNRRLNSLLDSNDDIVIFGKLYNATKKRKENKKILQKFTRLTCFDKHSPDETTKCIVDFIKTDSAAILSEVIKFIPDICYYFGYLTPYTFIDFRFLFNAGFRCFDFVHFSNDDLIKLRTEKNITGTIYVNQWHVWPWPQINQTGNIEINFFSLRWCMPYVNFVLKGTQDDMVWGERNQHEKLTSTDEVWLQRSITSRDSKSQHLEFLKKQKSDLVTQTNILPYGRFDKISEPDNSIKYIASSLMPHVVTGDFIIRNPLGPFGYENVRFLPEVINGDFEIIMVANFKYPGDIISNTIFNYTLNRQRIIPLVSFIEMILDEEIFSDTPDVVNTQLHVFFDNYIQADYYDETYIEKLYRYRSYLASMTVPLLGFRDRTYLPDKIGKSLKIQIPVHAWGYQETSYIPNDIGLDITLGWTRQNKNDRNDFMLFGDRGRMGWKSIKYLPDIVHRKLILGFSGYNYLYDPTYMPITTHKPTIF